MLTFASTSSSSDLLLPMHSSYFDVVKPSIFYTTKNMLFSEFSSAPDADTSSEFADDSGFFDDSETSHNTCIGHEIGTKLAAMCDDFDAQMMSYSRSCPTSRSFLGRVFDFFAF